MTKVEKNRVRQEAEQILSGLTLDEKIGMIHGNSLFQTKGVDRLGIPPLKMSDGPMGVRQEFENDSWKPLGYTDDYVTYLPCNSALAATWNLEVSYGMGQILGAEARGRGKDIILAPGVNIKRSPLCGRNFEYFSEDPYLTKKLVVPFIQGVQEFDVAACIKHFVVNNQETQRLWVDVVVDEVALRELYLPAFYAAVVQGDSYSVMGAYNKLYGEHCCHSKFLLDQVLREEWEYDGVVVSDWGAVHDTKEAAMSTLDIEMSVTNNFKDYYMANPLKEAVEKGEIPESVVNEKVTRIIMLMMRLHMLKGERKSGCYNTPKHRQKALEAAQESIVLLKNEEERLPLNKQKLKRLLVIGDNAECIHSNGGGSAEIKALYEISPLMGLKSKLGGNTEVTYVRGYYRNEKKVEEDINWQETSLENGGGSSSEEIELDQARIQKQDKLREEAVRLAKEYDQVIFIGGLNHEQDCEGSDREDMRLPYDQDLLIKEVLEANPQTVIVMIGGSPVEMGQWVKRAKAVVWSWYAGMEGGNALADVLLGNVNPSGKLPETFYKHHLDCSAHSVGEFATEETVNYKEGLFVGYRYNDTYEVEPEFCFGHGLSYTQFDYRNLEIKQEKGSIVVSLDVQNTGIIDGAEVVQVYVSPVSNEIKRPNQELKGFLKVYLKAGKKQNVSIDLLQDELCRYDKQQHKFVPFEYPIVIRVGSSSRNIRLEGCLMQ